MRLAGKQEGDRDRMLKKMASGLCAEPSQGQRRAEHKPKKVVVAGARSVDIYSFPEIF
jgi:hypothetical protein